MNLAHVDMQRAESFVKLLANSALEGPILRKLLLTFQCCGCSYGLLNGRS